MAAQKAPCPLWVIRVRGQSQQQKSLASTTKKKEEVLPGLEPGLQGSEPWVLTNYTIEPTHNPLSGDLLLYGKNRDSPFPSWVHVPTHPYLPTYTYTHTPTHPHIIHTSHTRTRTTSCKLGGFGPTDADRCQRCSGGVVGYHACLTRTRSRVRSSSRVLMFFFWYSFLRTSGLCSVHA
jgi:hypothetical protein